MSGNQSTMSAVDADTHQLVSALFEMLGSGDMTQIALVAAELADNPDANAQFRSVFADAQRALQEVTSVILARDTENRASPRLVSHDTTASGAF